MTVAESAEIQKRPDQKDPAAPLLRLIESQKEQIARALPKHLSADRMARIAATAVRKTKHLAAVDPLSFAGCIMDLAQIGLEPNTPLGHAYLIPRKSKGGGYECTLIVGYQGFLDLARRSGLVRKIYAVVVRQGDEFVYERGLDEKLVHRPKPDNANAPMTHVYAVAHLKDGDPVFEVLDKSEVEKRRKRGASGMGFSTPWDTDPDAMAKKSAVRALWPWLPKSAEMAKAAEIDDASARLFEAHGRDMTKREFAEIVAPPGSFLAAVSGRDAIDVQSDAPSGDMSPEEMAEAERLSRGE